MDCCMLSQQRTGQQNLNIEEEEEEENKRIEACGGQLLVLRLGELA